MTRDVPFGTLQIHPTEATGGSNRRPEGNRRRVAGVGVSAETTLEATVSDPNYNRRNQPGYRDDTSYTGWIIGAIVTLAIIVGGFMLFGRDAGTSNTASNASRPATTTTAPAPAAPATTGTATPGTTGSGTAR
jgi:hypothetical protein